MIGSRIRPIAGCAPKINFAIGTPEANVFFEPQNIAAIRSSRLKPSARAAQPVANIATVKIKPAASTTSRRLLRPLPDQTPCRNESQNDV